MNSVGCNHRMNPRLSMLALSLTKRIMTVSTLASKVVMSDYEH